MNTRTVLSMALVISAGTAGSAVMADPAPNSADASTASVSTSQQQQALAEKQKAATDDCVRQVGERTEDVRRQCQALNSSTYSKSDIDSTGANNMSDALGKLDPRVSVGHR